MHRISFRSADDSCGFISSSVIKQSGKKPCGICPRTSSDYIIVFIQSVVFLQSFTLCRRLKIQGFYRIRSHFHLNASRYAAVTRILRLYNTGTGYSRVACKKILAIGKFNRSDYCIRVFIIVCQSPRNITIF